MSAEVRAGHAGIPRLDGRGPSSAVEGRAALTGIGCVVLEDVFDPCACGRAEPIDLAAGSTSDPTLATLHLLALRPVLDRVVDLFGANIWVLEATVDHVRPPAEDPPTWRRDLAFVLDDLIDPEPPRLGLGALFVLGDDAGVGAVRWSMRVPGSGPLEAAETVGLAAGSAIVYDARWWHTGPQAAEAPACRVLHAVYGPRWLRRPRAADPWRRVPVGDPILAQLLDAPGISRVSDIGVSNRYNPFDRELPLNRLAGSSTPHGRK